ncbi:biopolymer transporter ExbD [bacterium]|nr:biopolymer transporter ExbD [bacterium]
MTVKRFESINVVPFIDIMLVLLVIVLTTATFVAKGIIPVELPSAKSAVKQDIPSVTITIKENGEMFFEESRTELKEIGSRIAKYDVKTPININCDKEARFDLFVLLVDTLKQKNYNNIGIITQREGNGASL